MPRASLSMMPPRCWTLSQERQRGFATNAPGTWRECSYTRCCRRSIGAQGIMIRAFVIAPTPMILAGLHAMLTTDEIQVVGESASPAEIIVELPTIDVIVVDHLLLEDVARAIANDSSAGRIALVVLTNSGERPLTTLRTLALRGWGVVPVEATSAELQAVVAAVVQGFVVLPAALSEQFSEPRPVVVGTLNLSSPDEALTNREREVLE